MRVLLTGAGGFVGSHILEHLLINTDWDFVCICSWKHKGTPERLERAMRENKDRVRVITHDLVSPLTERTVERLGDIDYILNVASESHVDRSITEPVTFIQNNVNLELSMLELARQIKPKKFIQFSTDEVYGVAPDGVNHKEWSSILPSNPYSASKAAQEAIAISYWRTYGVPLIITNTMNIFGETQDPEKFIAMLIRNINLDEPVTVHGNKNQIGSRFYLHARNCADAIMFIIKNVEPVLYKEGVIYPERFNIVGDIEMNNLDIAKLVANILGKPLKFVLDDFHANRPGHDRRYALDGQKLKDLGWQAPMDFEASLRRYISWTLEHPIWL